LKSAIGDRFVCQKDMGVVQNGEANWGNDMAWIWAVDEKIGGCCHSRYYAANAAANKSVKVFLQWRKRGRNSKEHRSAGIGKKR